jgi:hypothetical protein
VQNCGSDVMRALRGLIGVPVRFARATRPGFGDTIIQCPNGSRALVPIAWRTSPLPRLIITLAATAVMKKSALRSSTSRHVQSAFRDSDQNYAAVLAARRRTPAGRRNAPAAPASIRRVIAPERGAKQSNVAASRTRSQQAKGDCTEPVAFDFFGLLRGDARFLQFTGFQPSSTVLQIIVAKYCCENEHELRGGEADARPGISAAHPRNTRNS